MIVYDEFSTQYVPLTDCHSIIIRNTPQSYIALGMTYLEAISFHETILTAILNVISMNWCSPLTKILKIKVFNEFKAGLQRCVKSI